MVHGQDPTGRKLFHLSQPMPSVTIKGIKGVFTQAEKERVIKRMSDVLAEIKGEKIRPVTWVVFEEADSGSAGIGGEIVTAEGIKKLLGA